MSLMVYLSGPISGKSFEEATDWRKEVSIELHIAGFRVRDPLRGKSFSTMSHQKKINPKEYNASNNPTLSDKALKNRDKLDVLSSDIVLANFMEASQVSIGTVFELAWAEDHNKLVIVALPKKDTLHDHPFIRESAVIFHSLEDAVRYTVSCGVEEMTRD